MLPFRKILFPTDLSEHSAEALPYLARIAKEFGSHIVLLRAFDSNEAFAAIAAAGGVIPGGSSYGLTGHAEAALAQFGKEALSGLPVERVLGAGEAADCISHYAEAHAIDLIVMPTHGRGRFRRLLLGSVTSKVLHDVPIPVWTTAHAETLAQQSSQPIRNILVAVDLSCESPKILAAASEIGGHFGATLRLVHAVTSVEVQPGVVFPGGVIDDAPFQRFLLDTARQRMTALQCEAQTNFEVCIQLGIVATVLREAAIAQKAQLMIVGRGRLTKPLGRLRTNISSIIRDSPCPVLSL